MNQEKLSRRKVVPNINGVVFPVGLLAPTMLK